MAIYDYNLSAADVLDKVPLDTRRVKQSSGRVSKDDIEGYIDEYASIFSGMLEKSGLDGSDLSDEAEAQIQKGILHGAAAETLQNWGHTGEAYRQRKSTYESILERYEQDVQKLDRTTSQYDSNIDTTDDESPYTGTSWEM